MAEGPVLKDRCGLGKGVETTGRNDYPASVAAGSRILMLAPEPVLRPRGTPLSVLARLRALSEIGCRVDLVTYPFGSRVDLPGVRVYRCGMFPVWREPPAGPSLAKAVLDARMPSVVLRLLRRGGYDLVHTHEEAAVIGAWLRRYRGLPHLYEMHSSLPEQLYAGGWIRREGGVAMRLARRLEGWVLDNCDAVVVVYPEAGRLVRERCPGREVFLIENPPLTYTLGSAGCGGRVPAPVPGRVLYAGNLARNQGVEMLLEAMALVVDEEEGAHLLVVGGSGGEVFRIRRRCRSLGIGGCVRFLGRRPPGETLALHFTASVLVSPRLFGWNVPSKLYTYLAVGRPVVATDVPAHRQVLDGGCAELVAPQPKCLAEGILRVLRDEELGRRLVMGGRRRFAERFTPEGYRERVAEAVAAVRRGGLRGLGLASANSGTTNGGRCSLLRRVPLFSGVGGRGGRRHSRALWR